MPDGSSNSAPIAPQATAFPPISEVKGRSVPTYWQGRREWNLDRGVDNMPNLWRVGDNLYDLAGFEHPGGVDLLSMSKGTDITEAFEAHHIDIKKARAVLDKYFVQPATWARESPLTVEPNGFYSILRDRVNAKVKEIGAGPLRASKIYNDLFAASYVVTTLLASRRRSWPLAMLAAFLQALTVTAAHNFGHRNNWRRYYLDLCGRSSTIWRIHHEISHHLYPNSSIDIEVPGGEYAMDVSFFTEGKRSTNGPYVDLVSMVSKFLWNSVSPTFLHPLAHMEKKEYFNHLFLPLGYYLRRTSANRGTALGDAAFVLGAWTLGRAAVAGWILFTGVLAGHYNSDTWRQGEEAPKLDDIKDFGLFQIETTGDRTEFYSANSNPLKLPVILTTFGDHTLHHLFPAVDHAYHSYLYPVLAETCNEFGVRFEIRSTHETMWSVVEQASRTQRLEAPRRTGWDGRFDKGWVDTKSGFKVGAGDAGKKE